jgi:hypothetical protein
MVSSKTGEGINQAFLDLTCRMIRIANEIIKSKMTSFLTPNNQGAVGGEGGGGLDGERYHGDPDDDNFTYKSYTKNAKQGKKLDPYKLSLSQNPMLSEKLPSQDGRGGTSKNKKKGCC